MTPLAGLITQAILQVAGHVPESSQAVANNPRMAAQRLARIAAKNAALTSSALALAPGPLGLLTLIPDLITVWKIQAQLVADIAAVYGQKGHLTREHMLFCIFKHTTSQALRDAMVRAGERLVGRSVSRFVPVLGAMGVGGYAYYDTTKVAAAAIALFESKISV